MALKFMLDPLHLFGQKGKNVWEVLMRGTHHSHSHSNGWNSAMWLHLLASETGKYCLVVFLEGKGKLILLNT